MKFLVPFFHKKVPFLANIENCSKFLEYALHTVGNAFKFEEVPSGWKMKKLMSSVHKMFEESPSPCADYKNITESNDEEFPMLFLSDRWVENEPIASKSYGYVAKDH